MVLKGLGDKGGTAAALFHLGGGFEGAGELFEARIYFYRAEAIIGRRGKGRILAEVHLKLGRVYEGPERFGEAFMFLEKAGSFFRAPGDSSELAEALLRSGLNRKDTKRGGGIVTRDGRAVPRVYRQVQRGEEQHHQEDHGPGHPVR